MTFRFSRLSLCFGLFLSGVAPLLSAREGVEGDWLRHGTPVTQVYTTQDTGMQGPLRVVRELESGGLLVGGWNGLFHFDGSRWERLPGIQRSRCLFRRRDGRLMLGGAGQLVELRANAHGVLQDMPSLPLAGEENVLDFMTETEDGRLVVQYGKGVAVEQAAGGFVSHVLGTWVRGPVRLGRGVYVTVNNHEYHLCRLDLATGVALDVEGGLQEQLRGRHIVDLFPGTEKACWVATRDGSLWTFDGERLSPVPWAGSPAAAGLLPSCLLELPTGEFAVGTKNRGVQFFSAAGEWLGELGPGNGLEETSVSALSVGRDEGLWVCCARSLVRVDLRRRFLDFGERQGLHIMEAEAVLRHRGRLYVAGEEGLFEQDPRAQRREEAFHRIEGLFTARGLTSDGEVLWAGGNQLAGLMPDGRLEYFPTGSITGIVVPTGLPDFRICSTIDGFAVLERKAGQWALREVLPLGGPTCYNLGERVPGEWWAGCGTGVLARLRWREGRFETAVFGATEGVPRRWIDTAVKDGDLYAGGLANQVVRFVPETGRFTPEPTLRYEVSGAPIFYYPTFTMADGSDWVHPVLRSSPLVRRPQREVGTVLQLVAHAEDGLGRGLYLDEDGSRWICHVGGVLRYRDVGPETRDPAGGRLLVRAITDLRSGRVLAGNRTADAGLELPYAANSLRVEAAFADLRASRYNRFRIWLEGFEPRPAEWALPAVREFTNLPEGRYRLRVEGRDGAGMAGEARVVEIRIRPPWQRSAAAVALYALGAFALIVLTIWIRERRLRTRTRELGLAVEEGRRQLEARHRELQEVHGMTAELARDLVETNRALQSSTRAKTEFVRSVSHELRNPLAAAQMMAEFLAREQAGLPSASREQVLKLGSCVEYMQTLLDETLDLAQIEAGHIATRWNCFEAPALAAGVAALFEPVAEAQGLRLAVDTSAVEGLGPVWGDQSHAKRILVNFLSNAFKFTRNGEVRLSLRVAAREGECVRLRYEVADTGGGVPEFVRARLFSKFLRESSRQGGPSKLGAGLGLALCRQLAELVGGAVGYEPRPEGGSLFWVELPCLQLAGPCAPGDSLDGCCDFSGLKVAILDKDEAGVETLASMLEQFGVCPRFFTSHVDLEKVLEREGFDLVFADHGLLQSGKPGLARELCRRVEATRGGRLRLHLCASHWTASLAEQAPPEVEAVHAKPLRMPVLYQLLRDSRG